MTHVCGPSGCSDPSHLTEAVEVARQLYVPQGSHELDRLLVRYAEVVHPEIYDCRACPKDVSHCPQDLIVNGQKHQVGAVFNTCSDSRAHAGTVFQPRPGDIFQISDAGLLLTPHTYEGPGATTAAWGSFQYALSDHVAAENFVQFGHTKCGAMAGLLALHFNSKAITRGPLLDMLRAVAWMVNDAEEDFRYRHGRKPEREELSHVLEEHNVRKGAKLVEDFIADFFPNRKINVQGWLYDIEGANILAVQKDGSFAPITNLARRVDYGLGLPDSCATGMDEIGQRLQYPDGSAPKHAVLHFHPRVKDPRPV